MLSSPFIIVASDLSEASDRAIKAAHTLCERTNGKMQVIHVSPSLEERDWLSMDIVMSYYPEDFKRDIVVRTRKELSSQLEQCGVADTGEVLVGQTVSTILNYVSEKKADLLVLGHKAPGRYLHLGGVSAKIMAASPIPVLIVNQEFEVERIAGLVDPHEPEKKVFNVTEELGFLCSGNVEFVSVWPDKNTTVESTPTSYKIIQMTDAKKKEIKEQMESTLKRNADPHSVAKIRSEITQSGKVEELVKILNEDHIDLAVMMKHQKGILEKILLGSVTKGVLNRWHGNLLILPS